MRIFVKFKHFGLGGRDGADPAHTRGPRGDSLEILGTIEQQELLRSTSSALCFTVRKAIEDDEALGAEQMENSNNSDGNAGLWHDLEDVSIDQALDSTFSQALETHVTKHPKICYQPRNHA